MGHSDGIATGLHDCTKAPSPLRKDETVDDQSPYGTVLGFYPVLFIGMTTKNVELYVHSFDAGRAMTAQISTECS